MDIIDGTKVKSSYDNLIDSENTSKVCLSHELVVSGIEQVCAANE